MSLLAMINRRRCLAWLKRSISDNGKRLFRNCVLVENEPINKYCQIDILSLKLSKLINLTIHIIKL